MTYDFSQTNQALLENLRSHFGGKVQQAALELGDVQLEVADTDLLEVMKELRDLPQFSFSLCVDVCGVDYLGYGQAEWSGDKSTSGFSRASAKQNLTTVSEDQKMQPRRFAVVYHLLSVELNHRLRVKTFPVDIDLPVVPSMHDIWPGVNWFEREVYDMYGIRFDGHPDLRRILTDYGFEGHPFRKDFPLSGYVEMVYDETEKRVKYQPVDVETRVLVPRTIRERSKRPASPAVVDEAQAAQETPAT
jgi:NADH-quinone oxidoreductase subunit C